MFYFNQFHCNNVMQNIFLNRPSHLKSLLYKNNNIWMYFHF